jgi:hypothetical protein
MAETTAPRTGDRRRLVIVAAAGLSALALLIWMVTGQTQAGFTDSVVNAGNVFEAGTINITSTQEGLAILSVEGLLPGDSDEGDITIHNASDAPLKLKIYTSDLGETPSTSGIAENLNVTITRTDGAGSTPVFDGTLAEFAAQATEFDDGVSGDAGGDPMAPTNTNDTADDVTYHIVVELDPGAGRPSQGVGQGDGATVKIVFEAKA